MSYRSRFGFLLLLPAILRAADAPSRQNLNLDLSGTTASRLMNGDAVIDHQSNASVLFSYIHRQPIKTGPVYWNAGVFMETFWFANAHNFSVHQLQGYAAQFSLEYFVKESLAAYIKLRPGFYFENRAAWDAWDVPVEAVTGVPIRSHWNCVLGIANGRFYHHPLPIAGVSWQATPTLQVNAVYPEPSLIAQLNDRWESKLGGELLGDGFKTDSSRVEYFEYRIGETVKFRMNQGWKLIGGAGYELKRHFDFYREDTQLNARGSLFVHLGIEYAG